MKNIHRMAIAIVAAVLLPAVCCAQTWRPWDELTEASWVDFGDQSAPNMYPVNAGRNGIRPAYPIAFTPAAASNRARGMNALRFGHAGQITGRMVSADLAGSFRILNTGDHNTFTEVLIVAAVNADTAPDLTLALAGQTPYVFEPNDFAHYDSPFGRPSGFYYTTRPDDPHATNPPGEPIAYAFDKALVTVWAVEGPAGLAPGQTITVDYSFNRLTGPVVFSIYGYVGTDPLASIYHTNRAFVDLNDNKENPVSTFAVTIPGDLNRDLKVDLADLAELAVNWLKGAR
jgi:hypothetical protein